MKIISRFLLSQYIFILGKFYKLSIALPGSILNNAQTMELRTYLAGQVQFISFCLLHTYAFYAFYISFAFSFYLRTV